MKKFLFLYVALFLALPSAMPENVPAAKPNAALKEEQWIVPCVLACLVIVVGGCVVIKLKKYCDCHLGTGTPPSTNDVPGCEGAFSPPLVKPLPPLLHGDTSTNGYALLSSSDGKEWSSEFDFKFSMNWETAIMTVTAYRGTQTVSVKSSPVIEGRAYFDFRGLCVPERPGLNLFRTVTVYPQ
jgi:hypothetical protein